MATQAPDQAESISGQALEVALDRRFGPVHIEIIRMLAFGMKNKDIARTLDVSTSMVSLVKHDPELQPLMQAMFDLRNKSVGNIDMRIASQMKSLASKGLDRLSDVLDPLDEGGISDPETILNITLKVLDRVGFGTQRDARGAQDHNASSEILASAAEYAESVDGKPLFDPAEAQSAIKNCIDVQNPNAPGDALEADTPTPAQE